ncbi:VPGUxxT family thioredoxin-like (seleno)protein, type 2 [Rubripirellula obstinata]|nr:VPGUxxT family thioredoxin-like (seleno)protein, type 2 [Rubripirellula obstinata]
MVFVLPTIGLHPMKRLTIQAAIAVVAGALLLAPSAPAQTTPAQTPQANRAANPIEVGTVDWSRDLDAALASSKESGKPVFLLFQEVPGCSGCRKFGREVLSQPLLVEAIEDEFIPVVVFNNRSSGTDKKLLDKFGEPAWNYQVVRFLDADGSDIIERQDGIWSVGGIASRMIQTLQQHKRSVPKYLQTVAAVANSSAQNQVAFAQHCFWTGEANLGGIEGVIATEAGWLEGREVTLVRFDQESVSLPSLAQQAARVRCADKVYTRQGRPLAGLRGGVLGRSYRTASASDQKRQLSRWPAITRLPGINAMQLTKINSLASRNADSAMEWLSPRQRELLSQP